MPNKPASHRPARPPLHDGRESASARGYDSRWRKLRLVVLREKPVCEACGRESAAHVDHKVALAQGGTNELANLVSLCHSCHSKKTCELDYGFGRAPKEKRG